MTDLSSVVGPSRLTLRSTLTSPFGRKVRMAAYVLGLHDRIDLVPAQPMEEGDSIRLQNPVGKMPTLLLPDGTAVYDSRIIIEFLQELAGTTRLLPVSGLERYRALTGAALADGIMDAGILVQYEKRWRPAELHVAKWVDYQRGKILRGLSAFEKNPPDPAKTDIVCIGLACALRYIDWRQQVDWRSNYPNLVKWLARFADLEPAFNRSEPPPEDLR